MIIYGWKSIQLSREPVAESCPHCQNYNTLTVYVFQKYAHVFWIPFFPIGKTGASQCAHCKQVLKSKQMPPTLRLAYDNVATQAKTPYWTFVGVAILAVVIVIGMLASGGHSE
ncbi:zinc-ribbon domain-containing protein [Puia dinghuensis]|uniref:Zinc-ribbon 15 domain-containing protein n=1 Tax=Puia dinghuensis TaxID=1792502 RepID=A0A8J2UCV1_9BACT|nr:zinc-ribbon domain-containing protein [Puia dinghuensis]GGA97126.1 hypothetical protein GCM10011511_20560 [Puia dinghuensis]